MDGNFGDLSLDRLAEYCTALDLQPATVSDTALMCVLPIDHGPRPLLLELEAERQVTCFNLPVLLKAPAERRAAVALVAMHINYTLLLGGFRLDIRDGELAFGLSVPCRGNGFGREQFEHCVAATGWTLNKHLPLLLRACWSREAPEEILELPLPSPLSRLFAAGADDGSN